MKRWAPGRIWQGQDAYVIGGGPSLRTFDWELIAGRHTVGCNSAYILGGDVVEILLWGDLMWWEKIGKKGTEKFSGTVVGSAPKLEKNPDPCPWLNWMPRHDRDDLGTEALGWFGNTGAMAINLALILGATSVFLLGFDMGAEDPVARPNWHTVRYEEGRPDVYPRFMHSMRKIPQSLSEKFPGARIINVTDCSKLELFPKQSLAEHFGRTA